MDNFRCSPVFEMENIRIPGRDLRDVTAGIRQAGDIGDGTIVIRFCNKIKQGHMALLSILTDQYPASYLTAYIKHANQLGFLKTRVSADQMTISTLDIHADISVDFGYVHTMALTARAGHGYTLYFDGQKVAFLQDESAALLSDLLALGPIDRAVLGNYLEPQKVLEKHYPFYGDIDFLRIYDQALPEEYLLPLTGQFSGGYAVPIPLGTWRSAPENLFEHGMYGSRGYRIPTLLRTKTGAILALIDQRFFGGADHPNRIHTILRRSEDNGETWSEPIQVIAMPGNAQTIDTCSVQDAETGRIFLITDAFPETMTTFTVSAGTGWKYENGENCRILVNGKETYLAHPDGQITKDGVRTDYHLDKSDVLFGKDGECLGNIWMENARLRLHPTDHLLLLTSDDDGRTWQPRCDLNPAVKQDWMRFMGCGPGNGIQLQNGPHRGRMLLPIYYFNACDRQAAALIYSDDHGETWKMGASPIDGWEVEGKTLNAQTLSLGEYETLEAQPVELPDGSLLYIMRNGRRKALCAFSDDGGETWATKDNYYDDSLTGPCGQFGIIRSGLKLEGKEAYFCSIHLDQTNTGTVLTGYAEQQAGRWRINWAHQKTVWEGTYCYSSICMAGEDRVAVFFESSSSLSMTFQRMDLPFLLSAEQPLDPIHVSERRVWLEEGKLRALIRFNQPIMPMDDLCAIIQLGEQRLNAPLQKRSEDASTLYFCVDGPAPVDAEGARVKLSPKLLIYNRRGARWTDDE